jgi:hypothetical protein
MSSNKAENEIFRKPLEKLIVKKSTNLKQCKLVDQFVENESLNLT